MEGHKRIFRQMNKFIFTRTFENDKETIGQGGVVDDKGANIYPFVTLELADKNNKRSESRIPSGRYFYKKVLATHNIPYEHLMIQSVVGRDGICVHAGNYFFNSKGCILVGDKISDINGDGEQDITASKMTLSNILFLLPDEGIIDISEKFSS